MDKMQLFCFTHAGGTSAFFDIIKNDIPNVDLVAFEYAGHGKRKKEGFYKDFDELADDLFAHFKELYQGGDYALFGYSMGSISLIEVLKRIVSSGMKKPSHIFLGAHEPHVKSELLNFNADELDEWVKKRTISFGAIPPKIVNNKVFWRMYLPLYRVDFTIIGKYDYGKFNLSLDVPTTVFYSETDTPLMEMKLWDKYFPCEYYEFDGNHFFIQQHHKEMGAIISKQLGAKR